MTSNHTGNHPQKKGAQTGSSPKQSYPSANRGGATAWRNLIGFFKKSSKLRDGLFIALAPVLLTLIFSIFINRDQSNLKIREEMEIDKAKRTLDAQAAINAATLTSMPLAAPTTKAAVNSKIDLTPTNLVQGGCAPSFPPRYGFECGQSGWDVTTDMNLRNALTDLSIGQTTGHNLTPTQALKAGINFSGSKHERSVSAREKVEVQVDINASPPAGAITSYDFTGKSIEAYIWGSKGSRGDPNFPNGIQVFVKDTAGKTCYTWNKMPNDETWFRAIWNQKSATHCQSGFDSAHPQYIGIQIAVNPDTTASFPDPLTIYIDDVNWPDP